MTDKEYSEYGYRGLEEVLAKEAEIKELKKEISELRMKLQEAENQIDIVRHIKKKQDV